MKATTIIRSLVALAVVATLGFAGCSSDEESSATVTPVQQMVEAVAESVASNLEEARLVSAEAVENTAEEKSVFDAVGEEPTVAMATGDFAPVEDMTIVGTNLYALTGDGVMVYDMVAKTKSLIASELPLHAIAEHAGKMYVGGAGLFVIEDDSLMDVTGDINQTITRLTSYSYRLLIGTEKGLFSRSIFGDETLLDDVWVNDITTDDDGVWVGTSGQGLYSWYGADFKRRYLERDRQIFDFVTALDYKNGHLYAGTPHGLFIHDGGRWQELRTTDGLPSDRITDIDASDWVVVIGTERGVIGFFNGDFLPVPKLENVLATRIVRYDNKILVGTDSQSVLVKAGPVMKPLFEGAGGTAVDVFTALQ